MKEKEKRTDLKPAHEFKQIHLSRKKTVRHDGRPHSFLARVARATVTKSTVDNTGRVKLGLEWDSYEDMICQAEARTEEATGEIPDVKGGGERGRGEVSTLPWKADRQSGSAQ